MPFNVPALKGHAFRKCQKRMAGTTGLEPATSAVTVQGIALQTNGLQPNPFVCLARTGTQRNAQARYGKKN